jgi:large subunit ribosomal protein L18
MLKSIKNKKRRLRNRKHLKSVNSNRFRLSVFKSLKNLSAQVIDDNLKKTLVSASSSEKDIKKQKMKKKDMSVALAKILAERIKKKNIENIYFDRGQYKYHGRIKEFADSLRKTGLKF